MGARGDSDRWSSLTWAASWPIRRSRPGSGRLVILVLVLLVGWVIGMLLGYFTRSMGLGPLDRVIGLLFGIVRGMVLVGLMIIGGELLHLNQEDWWGRSKLVPYGEAVGDWLRAMVGEHGEPWSKLERLTGVKVRAQVGSRRFLTCAVSSEWSG